MQDQNIVAIFNTSWALVGHVERHTGKLVLVEDALGQVPEVVEFAMQEFGFPGADIAKLQAHLKQAGIKAYILGSALLEAVRKVSRDEFPAEVRVQVVPEILGLDADHALAALEAVLEST